MPATLAVAEGALDTRARTNSSTARIFLLQNHPLMVLGTQAFLNKQEGLSVCGHALVPEETYKKLPDPPPDLIVFELSICGPFDFSFLKKLRQALPDIPVLAYSYHEEMIFAQRAIEAGARGYLMKEAAPDNLAEAIRQVLKGRTYLAERVLQRQERDRRAPDATNGSLVQSLTNRELQIFQALGEGLTDDTISLQTGLTAQSISNAQYRMRKKMGLQNRAELVLCAMHWAYYEGDFA